MNQREAGARQRWRTERCNEYAPELRYGQPREERRCIYERGHKGIHYAETCQAWHSDRDRLREVIEKAVKPASEEQGAEGLSDEERARVEEISAQFDPDDWVYFVSDFPFLLALMDRLVQETNRLAPRLEQAQKAWAGWYDMLVERIEGWKDSALTADRVMHEWRTRCEAAEAERGRLVQENERWRLNAAEWELEAIGHSADADNCSKRMLAAEAERDRLREAIQRLFDAEAGADESEVEAAWENLCDVAALEGDDDD